MQFKRALSLLFLAVVMLAGCSSMPQKNARLEDARSSYQAALNNPQVANYAALELKDAGQALNEADEAWKKRLGKSKVEPYSGPRFSDS